MNSTKSSYSQPKNSSAFSFNLSVTKIEVGSKLHIDITQKESMMQIEEGAVYLELEQKAWSN